jgi:peptidoglycan/xylan/chitin deacetylase (PgdA/CDA1 family)
MKNRVIYDAFGLQPIPDKLVVLTFDDGNKSDVTFVAPLLQEYGFKATFFITEGLNFLENKEHYMTWEEVRKLHEEGFEIGNHTRHHRNVNDQSREELLADLAHIDCRCQENGIPVPNTFCYPGYSHGQAAVEVLLDHGFHFARRGTAPEFTYNLEGGRGPAYDPTVHHPLLIPTTGASGPGWTSDDFVWAVEQAQGGKICVLTFHGVPALEHPWVNTKPEAFETCMNYLQKNDCTVVALGDLAQYVNPIAAQKLKGQA